MRIAWIMLALVACGPKQRVLSRDEPVPWERSGIDWTRPPALPAPLAVAPPKLDEAVLGNGVRVIVVRNPRLPIIAITAVIDGAGSRADGDMPGVAALTADLLDEGAGPHTADVLRRELETAGAHVEIRIATDAASVQLVAPKRIFGGVVPLLGEVIRKPRFDEPELVRVRQLRLAELTQKRERARTVAAQVFDRVTFGAHPYALPAEGNEAVVAKLTAADARAFWQRTYAPKALTVIMTGDVELADARRLVESAFGDWKHDATPSPAPPLAPFTPQLAFVDAPGATQSVVLIGTRAAAAGDERQLAGDVASSIVGGGVGARLDRKLHDELGLTLGASASFWRGRWTGSWALTTTFATDKTLAGIRAALEVIDHARASIDAGELARAKSNLLAAARQSFETTAGTARALERVVVQGLPLTWFATYAARLDALTLADVRAAASWPDLAVVIVGDWGKLGTQLDQLGLPIVQYRRDGTRKQ